MDYSQMLKTEEWKKKRNQIINRDNNKCQRCGFNPAENFPSGTVGTFSREIIIEKTTQVLNGEVKIVRFFDIDYNEWIYCKALKDLPNTFGPNQVLLVSNYIEKKFSNKKFNGSSINNLGKIFFTNNQINARLIKEIKKLIGDQIDFDNFDFDREAFYLSTEGKEREFLKSIHLHVHHRCYRKKFKIWNQPESDYVTLCNVCHRIVHENQLIPFYNENGDIYQYLTPCWKCGGLGYLECYKHIDNGICYACNGDGYQQGLFQFFN